MSERETPHPHPGEGDSDPQVEDPGDYNQRRRLESINNFRDIVLEKLALLEDTKQNHNQAKVACNLHGAVKAFLVNIESLMKDRAGEKFYTEPLGDIKIVPPSEYVLEDKRKNTYSLTDDNVQIIGDWPAPYEETVRGILSNSESGTGYLDYAPTIEEDWTVNVRFRHKGKKSLYGVNTTYMPVHVSDAAFRMGNEFLYDSGIDAQLDDGRPFADYS